MPFRLKDAPATFQRSIDIILVSVKLQPVTVYIDNIVIFSNAPEERLNPVEELLGLLRNADTTIKLKKYFSFTKTINNFGHFIALGKIQIAQETDEAIESLQYPKTVLELSSFWVCTTYTIGSYKVLPGGPSHSTRSLKEEPLQFAVGNEERSPSNILKDKFSCRLCSGYCISTASS